MRDSPEAVRTGLFASLVPPILARLGVGALAGYLEATALLLGWLPAYQSGATPLLALYALPAYGVVSAVVGLMVGVAAWPVRTLRPPARSVSMTLALNTWGGCLSSPACTWTRCCSS